MCRWGGVGKDGADTRLTSHSALCTIDQDRILRHTNARRDNGKSDDNKDDNNSGCGSANEHAFRISRLSKVLNLPQGLTKNN